MFLLRSPQTIAQALFATPDVPLLQPGHRWPALEISGDCSLLNAQQARSETQGRDVPLVRLGQDWWVFASSGTGDAWLMSLDRQQTIAFLDHDNGPDAQAEAMDIDFGQWLQLADLMQQWEQLDDESLSATLSDCMEQIAPGLSQRYPYSF